MAGRVLYWGAGRDKISCCSVVSPQPFCFHVKNMFQHCIAIYIGHMDRIVSFTMSHGDMRLLQTVLEAARSPHVSGRTWPPESAPEWADAWNNMSECLEMAERRMFHYREYGIAEVLCRFNTLLLRATLETWDKEDSCVAVLSCPLASFEHNSWHRYEQHVGGFHTSQFDAALLDGNELLNHLQNELVFVTPAFWLQMALSQLEGTRESMRRRMAEPCAQVFDFWVDAASMDFLKEKLHCAFGEKQSLVVNSVRETLWLSAARCAACAGDLDEEACLRTLRLVGSLAIHDFPMRLLPESPGCLVVPVDQPTWGREWPDALANPSVHLQTAETAERGLETLVVDVRSIMGDRIAVWVETALSATSATVEWLQQSAGEE